MGYDTDLLDFLLTSFEETSSIERKRKAQQVERVCTPLYLPISSLHVSLQLVGALMHVAENVPCVPTFVTSSVVRGVRHARRGHTRSLDAPPSPANVMRHHPWRWSLPQALHRLTKPPKM